MIPQIGFAEMLVLALLAIIVVGPRDLPKLMRGSGKFMAQVRSMGQEFKNAFDDMAAEDEMAELRREIEELKKLGEMPNLEADIFDDEMRELDVELREGTRLSSPKAPSKPEPKESSDGG